jgi:hypothetical protein
VSHGHAGHGTETVSKVLFAKHLRPKLCVRVYMGHEQSKSAGWSMLQALTQIGNAQNINPMPRSKPSKYRKVDLYAGVMEPKLKSTGWGDEKVLAKAIASQPKRQTMPR